MVKINFDSTGERKIGELTIAPVNFELLETQRQDLYKLLDSEENGLSAQETTSLEGILNFLNMICDSYIDEIVMDWWYNLSDYKTEEFIMKHKMRKPIREEKIIEVYKVEVGG